MALNLAFLALTLPVVIAGERVTIRAEAGLEKQAQHLADEASTDLRRIEADLDGLAHADNVEVRLVRHMEDIAAAAPTGRGAPEWAVGTAYPEEGVVVVALRLRNGDIADVDRTLAHELAHIALGRAIGNEHTPRWLTEGFAYLHSSDFSFERAATLTGAVIGHKIVPLAQLDEQFPEREDEAALAYAQSYDLVAFLARRGRWSDDRDDGDRSAFRAFLVELARGATPDGASRTAFGRRLVDVEAEWLESVRTRYLLYPIGLGGVLFWMTGALLLVLGWWRRRRLARRTLERWAVEEEAARAEAHAHDIQLN